MTNNSDIEIWKDIVGFDGQYQISNNGRYKSVEREVVLKDGRVRVFKSKILKPFISKSGYPTATLSISGKNIKRSVHRLVAETFIENSFNKSDVNHIDGNKENNKVENLEWVSHSENLYHFHKLSDSNSGERNNLSKLKDDDIPVIREMHADGISSKRISELFKVDYKTIWRIVTHQTWKNV